MLGADRATADSLFSRDAEKNKHAVRENRGDRERGCSEMSAIRGAE